MAENKKGLHGLLLDSIVELQKLQVSVSSIDDSNRTVGVAINEVEHKLHAASELLETVDRKYYFISYMWTKDGMVGWEIENDVSDIHPIEWIKECQVKYNDIYKIQFFSVISEEQFKLFNKL